MRDSLTAVAYFKRHTPEQFYDFVYQVSILPEHILERHPAVAAEDGRGERVAASAPADSGSPAWEPGKRLELVADTANYRGRAEARSHRIYADSRLQHGGRPASSLATPTSSSSSGPSTSRRSPRTPRDAPFPYPSLGYAYLALNNVDPKQPGQPHPIFGDRAVRRALSMAVDRRAMLNNVFGQYGVPLYGPFPRALTVADTTLPQLPYDTAKAKALLDSAGWLPGPDGVRVKNGRRLEFGITTTVSSAARKQYSVLLQEAFKRVGAAARIDDVDIAGFMAKNGDRSFDTIIELFATDPSPSGFKQSWSTSGIGKDGANYASYSNPRGGRAARQRDGDVRSRAHSGICAPRLRDDHRGRARHLAVRAC